MEKYTPLLEILAEQLKVDRGRVLPLAVGTTGCMPVATLDSLREIYINERGSYITISLLALMHSIEIYHTFRDYNALVACINTPWTRHLARAGSVAKKIAGRVS